MDSLENNREIVKMRVLVTGASGQLGSYVLDSLAATDHDVTAWSSSEAGFRGQIGLRPVDITSSLLKESLRKCDPEVVIHLAAMSTAEGVRLDPAGGQKVNVEATARIAAWCAREDRGLVFTSTDLVFPGTRAWNAETDLPEPVLAYGRTKAEAERFVRAVPKGLVARVALLFGASKSGKDGYFDRTMGAIRRGEVQTLFVDEFRTPLHLKIAAQALVRLAEEGATGVVHVAGRERMSRFDLISRAAATLGIDPSLVKGNRQSEARFAEPRPADVSLETKRWDELIPDVLRPALEDCLSQP
jgi:dTDP-4-dehydrorhamnose reductase